MEKRDMNFPVIFQTISIINYAFEACFLTASFLFCFISNAGAACITFALKWIRKKAKFPSMKNDTHTNALCRKLSICFYGEYLPMFIALFIALTATSSLLSKDWIRLTDRHKKTIK
jgi:ABC-type phosphate/phosphonate transport system permease subunit